MGARAKPMTATATSMVKAIWQSYFPSTAEGMGALSQPCPLCCDTYVLPCLILLSEHSPLDICLIQVSCIHTVLVSDEGQSEHFLQSCLPW